MKEWRRDVSYKGMETLWLILATVLAGAGAVFGWRGLRTEHHGRHAFWWMIAVFVCQLMFLGERGELRGQCPLSDWGERSLFLAWSLTFFYLVTGSTYRLSLLGVFTAPFVVLLQLVALIPGALEKNVIREPVTNAWSEAHKALSVLSYGALALAAVSGMMFLVLNRQLKEKHLETELVHGMPSIHRLVKAMGRITLLGWIILTAGVIAGVFLDGGEVNAHLMVATVTWVLYAVLLGVYFVRGLPGRQLAWGVMGLFVVSLLVFAKL